VNGGSFRHGFRICDAEVDFIADQEDWDQMQRICTSLSLFLTLNLVFAASLLGQGNSNNVRGLNGKALQAQAALHRADAAAAAQVRADAATIFAERAAALTALIKENPQEALGLAFSKELRDELAREFPASASNLEEEGEWTGSSDHLIFDDPERQVRKFQVQIQNGNDSAEVYSANGEPHCVSGDILVARGIRVGNVIAAGSTNVKSSGGDVAAAGCTTTGVQNSAIILVQFPGIPLPANVTPSGVWDIFFSPSGRSVNNYWVEASHGKASTTGGVFGPYTLDRVYSCDEYSQMRSAAIAAADADVNFQNFTRVFIVFPNPGSCGWAGLGTLGCGGLSSNDGNFTASTSWLLASYMGSRDNGVKLSTHEGGHNLTLHHASSRSFGTEALGPVGTTGTLSEYGDPQSTMGSWNFGQYAAPHKVRLGWLTGSNVVTTETNGSHTILPFENTTSSLQALKVRRGTGNNAWMWLEFRQPIGQYDSTFNSQIYTGALVHYEDSVTGTYTHLLDFTPATANFADASLVGTYTDPYSNVSLNVTGASASGVAVTVNYGPVPCVRNTPTIQITPGNPSVYSGSDVNYNVTVTNNDTTGCTSSTFDINSTAPAAWITGFSAMTLTLNPTQAGTVTMTKSVPAGLTPGTYGINATANDVNHSATGVANATVTTPPLPINMTLTVNPTTVKAKSTVTIQSIVTREVGGAPVSGASVVFTIVRAGSTTTKTVTTNASGVAVWSYKAQQRGTYTVTATANASGATESAGPVTFTAN
jgi:M6 family metalloprotease-like protein